MQAVDGGMGQEEAAKVFNISRKVINNWRKLRKDTGSFEPKTGYQKGNSHKIKDLNQFEKFVEENKNLNAPQMAVKWTIRTGIETAHDAITRGLKKINITYKKKLSTSKKPMLKNELLT